MALIIKQLPATTSTLDSRITVKANKIRFSCVEIDEQGNVGDRYPIEGVTFFDSEFTIIFDNNRPELGNQLYSPRIHGCKLSAKPGLATLFNHLHQWEDYDIFHEHVEIPLVKLVNLALALRDAGELTEEMEAKLNGMGIKLPTYIPVQTRDHGITGVKVLKRDQGFGHWHFDERPTYGVGAIDNMPYHYYGHVVEYFIPGNDGKAWLKVNGDCVASCDCVSVREGFKSLF